MSLSADSSPHWPREGQTARPGFAVAGIGFDALSRAHAVLAEGGKPRESFSAGNEVSIIFFSYQMGSYVHLQQVERRDKIIELRYCFIPHGERYVTAHLALIPLGKLPVGKYQVKIIQLPPVQESRDGGYEPVEKSFRNPSKEKKFGERFVSRSFSFVVAADADDYEIMTKHDRMPVLIDQTM